MTNILLLYFDSNLPPIRRGAAGTMIVDLSAAGDDDRGGGFFSSFTYQLVSYY